MRGFVDRASFCCHPGLDPLSSILERLDSPLNEPDDEPVQFDGFRRRLCGDTYPHETIERVMAKKLGSVVFTFTIGGALHGAETGQQETLRHRFAWGETGKMRQKLQSDCAHL